MRSIGRQICDLNDVPYPQALGDSPLVVQYGVESQSRPAHERTKMGWYRCDLEILLASNESSVVVLGGGLTALGMRDNFEMWLWFGGTSTDEGDCGGDSGEEQKAETDD